MRGKGGGGPPGGGDAAGGPAVGLWLGGRDLSGQGCCRGSAGAAILQVMGTRGCAPPGGLSPPGFPSGVRASRWGRAEEGGCAASIAPWAAWGGSVPRPGREVTNAAAGGKIGQGPPLVPQLLRRRWVPPAAGGGWDPPAPAAPALADCHLPAPGSGNRRLPAERAVVLEQFAK